jgi:dGTPase
MKSGASRGRRYPDDEHPYRSAYQKDRDRIVHTKAFRRLEYKTQVFVYHEGDHYRNRLTHTIEVAQIGRTMARALMANEDLAEAICLAHDLGHPPFGHTGEAALNEFMAGHGGFDHQRQTMRIVERLEERYPGFPGLNLTYEVREGLVKHDTDYDVTDARGYEPDLAGTLECQLANLADEIAYNAADLEDGLRSGILDPADVGELGIWVKIREALAATPDHPVPLEAPLDDMLRARSIRKLIGAEVTDAVGATARRLSAADFQSVDELRQDGYQVADFSPEMQAYNQELKAFLLEKFYRQWRVNRMAAKAYRILDALFSAYCSDPHQLPPHIQANIDREDQGLQRVVCDYVAGMTDRYAILEYGKLFDPETRV